MNHPFDEFSKSLSENSVPRRELLRRLGAVVAGGLLGPFAIGLDTASAEDGEKRDRWQRGRHRHRGSVRPGGASQQDPCVAFCGRCRTSRQRSQCLTACRGCNNDTSRLKGSCGNYVCCGSGQSLCGGRCVNFKTDPNNCGACGRVCGAGTTCANGTCTEPACPSGQTRCGSTCVNLSTDPSNCGTCGNACAAGQTCTDGTCSGGGGGGGCGGGATMCNGICTNTAFDPLNCGACGVVCPATQTCSGGVCQDNF